ncbi:MAG: rhodanese-like domain-containing protein [Gammaproteobacteria bacterium]|jgi:rhodanese-related sulfurtransferase|nr:rhodanese-like domain-containing protein [Gammaproteobacteria bacterium]
MERTIKPEDLKAVLDTAVVLDVRRESDYAPSHEAVPGSHWRNPENVDGWIDDVPRDREVVLYCVRGGSVSNSILDRLQAAGVKARYIEGGIEGWKAAGGEVTAK